MIIIFKTLKTSTTFTSSTSNYSTVIAITMSMKVKSLNYGKYYFQISSVNLKVQSKSYLYLAYTGKSSEAVFSASQ